VKRLTPVLPRVSLERPEPPVGRSSIQNHPEVGHAQDTTLFVGLDAHKDSISVATRGSARSDEPTFIRCDRHPAV
jgi:hypothetical protein